MSKEVMIDYTNWRGERRWRRIRPLQLAYYKSEYHDGEQWIMRALDVETEASREFAMKDIHTWKPVES